MPSRGRVRADQEVIPPVPGQKPSRRRKERAISRGEEDSPATALEDLELVVEHDGLKIQLIEATADEQRSSQHKSRYRMDQSIWAV